MTAKKKPKNLYIRSKKEVEKLRDCCVDYMRKSPKGSRLITPRGYKIFNEYIIANLEPVLARDTFVVGNCNMKTAGRYYYVNRIL